MHGERSWQVFGKFSIESWQVVVVVEIANLQRPRKKITRIACLVHGEHSGQPVTRYLTVWKTCMYAGSKVSSACRS